MKNILLFSLVTLLYQSCTLQAQTDHLSIAVPTVEQEASSIWRTINDVNFLEGQGYQIHLPEEDLISTLIAQSKNGQFGNNDFPAIYNLLASKVYNAKDYERALKKVNAEKDLINRLVQQLKETQKTWDWEFKLFDNYKVLFTLYGTGGSYDPDSGTVTLFTTTEGQFMKYSHPANTIVHEIVHMGIEHSIVQKYQLPHGLKERIVDTIVSILFKEYLPDYKIQNMGDTAIDQLLRDKEDLSTLDSIIQEYMTRN
ncbi:MAG: hypothetical protein AAGG75_20830 [Bacteroidota bacterium]